jgi:hypothetical protein
MWFAVIVLFFVAIKKPIQTWDILGYIAVVESQKSTQKNDIHSAVYNALKNYATDEEFNDLVNSSDYRKTMFEDADAFNQQIPFYKMRIIFIALISLFSAFGLNLFFASHLVVAASAVLGFIAFYYAYRKLIHPALWLVAPMFFIVLDGLSIARMVTADPLAFLWVGLISYAFIHKKWLFLFGLLVSSVLVRTDLLLLVAIMLTYLIIFKTELRLASGVTLIASIGAYWFANNYADNYGWSTVFYYAIISDMTATHPLEYSSIVITLSQYLSEVLSNLSGFIDEPPLLFFLTLVLLQFILVFILRDTNIKLFIAEVNKQKPFVLTIMSILYVTAHYLLFPVLENRFFVAEYLIALFGFLVVISNLLQTKR